MGYFTIFKDTLVLMQLFCVVSLNYDIINNGDKK